MTNERLGWLLATLLCVVLPVALGYPGLALIGRHWSIANLILATKTLSRVTIQQCHIALSRGGEITMSMTISYQPVSEGVILNGGTSSTSKALSETFGKFPIMLSNDDLPVLTGMAAVYRGEPNPFTQLMHAVDKYERIQVIVKH